MALNGLSGDRIYPGMPLKIPSGSGTGGSDAGSGNPAPVLREYTVRRGDSLWKIARSQLGAGSRYTEIMALNALESETIYPGQVLLLPAE